MVDFTIDELTEVNFRLSQIEVRSVETSQGCKYVAVYKCVGNDATLILDRCNFEGYFDPQDQRLANVNYDHHHGEQFMKGRKDIEGKRLVDSLIFVGESKVASDFRGHPGQFILYMTYDQFLENQLATQFVMRSRFNNIVP